MFELKNKVALITGGAKGIGFSIAEELLRNGLKGVALVDIDDVNGKISEETLRKKFSKDSVIYIKADVGQRASLEGAFEQTVKQFKQLDIVVNSAGIVQEVEWERCVAVNLQGCMNGSLLALDKYFPKYLGNSGGMVLNIASITGLEPLELMPVYAATKSGVITFSRAISGALRCGELNIKVLIICPGSTKTSIQDIHRHQVPEVLFKSLSAIVDVFPAQSPEQFAKHVIPILEQEASGTGWIIENNSRREIHFPQLYKMPEY